MASLLSELDEDDIECIPWLKEVSLEQYARTFMANLSSGENPNMLSRKKLKALRMRDFPSMNITNYEHQKTLMEHIRISLQYVFSSPVRKTQVQLFNELRRGNVLNFDDMEGQVASNLPPKPAKKVRVPLINLFENDPTDTSNQIKEKTISETRKEKQSFDERVWESISRLRPNSGKNKAIENLRRGIADVRK